MIKTISNPSFADRIISRHMTLLSVAQSPAELLFARYREHDEDGSRFSQSIRNIYFLNRLTNENNIFNIHLNLSFLSGIVSKTVREMNESATRHIRMLEKTFATGRGEPGQAQQTSLDYAGGTPAFLLYRQMESGSTEVEDRSGPHHTAPVKDNLPQKEVPGLIKTPTTKKRALAAAKTMAQREQERVQVMPAEHGVLRLSFPDVTGAKLLSALLIANRSVPVWHRYLWDSDVPGYGNHVNAVHPLRGISGQDDSVSALSRLIPPAARLLPRIDSTTQQSWTSGETNTTQPQTVRAEDVKSHPAKASQERGPGINTTVAPSNTMPSAQIHYSYPIWPESASKALQAQRMRPPETDNLQPPGMGISELENRLSHSAMSQKTKAMHHISQVPQAEEKSVLMRQTASTKMTTLREGSTTIAGQARNITKKDFPYADYPQKIQRISLSATPMLNTPVRSPVVNARFPLESGEPSPAYRQPQYVLPPHRPERADGTMLQIPILNSMAKPSAHAAPHMLPADAPSVLLPAVRKTPVQSGSYSLPDYTRNLTHAAKFTASGIRETEAPAHHATRMANLHAGRQPAYNAPAAIIYKKEQQRENPARQVPEPVKFSEDIEFIKKSVKQTAATTQTVRTNTAVNVPGNVTSSQGTALGIDQQVNEIADKVYSALERRLRSERMRKGLL